MTSHRDAKVIEAAAATLTAIRRAAASLDPSEALGACLRLVGLERDYPDAELVWARPAPRTEWTKSARRQPFGTVPLPARRVRMRAPCPTCAAREGSAATISTQCVVRCLRCGAFCYCAPKTEINSWGAR